MGLRTAIRNRTPETSRQEIVDTLDFCESLRQTDPAETLRVALDTSERAKEGGFVDLQGQALIRCAEAAQRLGRIDLTAEYLRQAEEVLSGSDALREKVYLHQGWGIYYKEQGDMVKAYDHLHRVLGLCVSAEHRRFRSRALNTLGNLFTWVGACDTALYYFFQCLEIAEAEQDQPMLGVVLGSIGSMYHELDDHSRALEFTQRALSICFEQNDEVGAADELKNIAVTYSMLNESAQAITHFEQALEIWRRIGNKRKEADVLSNIGKIHADAGDFDRALSYLEEAVRCSEDFRDTWEYAFILSCLGLVHQAQKEYSTALTEFIGSMQLYGKFGLRSSENEERKLISEVYEAMGDYQNSLIHYREYLKVREELQRIEMQRSIADQEVRQALQKAEEEKEMLRRQAEEAGREVEARMKELNALTVDLTERDSALKKIRADIEPLLDAGEEKIRKNAGRIARQIEEIVTEEKRNLFQEQFEGVYQEFIRQLRELCPSLTPTEIRVCVLIKLNLSNKQIAELLFTSPLTIKTHRAHIRRKLGLKTGENLSALLFAL